MMHIHADTREDDFGTSVHFRMKVEHNLFTMFSHDGKKTNLFQTHVEIEQYEIQNTPYHFKFERSKRRSIGVFVLFSC